MPVDELVDAAFTGRPGRDGHHTSLPDTADWDALDAARLKVTHNTSRDASAERYRIRQAA